MKEAHPKDTLQEVIPELVVLVFKCYDLTTKENAGEYEATVTFGEYASPSFDNVVEIVGKAKSYGVMSIEQCVEELYGDTWTDEEKAEEVQKIKEQNGMLEAEEPTTIDNDDIDDNGDLDEEE